MSLARALMQEKKLKQCSLVNWNFQITYLKDRQALELHNPPSVVAINVSQ